MKKIFSPFTRLPAVGRTLIGKTETHPFQSCLYLGLLMNVIIYCLHARSLFGGLGMMIRQPFYFLFNALIIIAFYSLSLFFSRRLFFMSLISVIWLALGITDCVLIGLRDLPLEAIDFYIARTGIAILHVYLGWVQLILIIVAILAVLALLVLLFIKCPRVHPDYVRSLLTVICCLLALLLLALAVVGLADADPQKYDNIKDAYDVYGFAYCFLRSIFERGIPQPENYSEEQLRELVTDLASLPSDSPPKTPNVIMVQLESFFDVNRVNGVTLSENPIPNFTAMKEQGTHGLISVPSIGAGTANTEFEVLSGLDLEFFGTGEYPYASILGDRTCETIAYSLAELGYSTHSMHNHTGTFYDRYRVYANLGFDTFTPAECMIGLEYTDLGWEKDSILTKYILKALTSTQSQDFVFAVSVQGHGKYPEIPSVGDGAITVTGIDDPERHNAFEYYVNQIHEMDVFIGELCDALLELGEDVVVVFYGDHLPALDMAEGEVDDLFQTDYVIWSNFDLPTVEVDVEAYQLSALVMDLLDVEQGLVNKIHQRYFSDPNYSNILQLVGYDMLYGDNFAFGGELPYKKRDTVIGLDPTRITDVMLSDDSEFFVIGQFFTPESCVFVNGHKKNTVFVSNELLAVQDELKAGDRISVVQISVDLQKLSQTPEYAVTADDLIAPFSDISTS